MSHGSFFSSEIEYGDAAVVVDGFYHHRLGPRHKEYLYALDRGVTVIGTVSIGAVRALELSAYGMAGFGAVRQLYRAGVFDGDDTVGVAHEEDAPYASLSVPLVNLYTAAQAARAARVLAARHRRRRVGAPFRVLPDTHARPCRPYSAAGRPTRDGGMVRAAGGRRPVRLRPEARGLSIHLGALLRRRSFRQNRAEP
ncbi:TfuA-like protein [Streptomyces uncialis]|uniref:TfuA-like protein n=1 Tax=Streptomyces uncialis TaxID=1048205 RepID=UPI00378AB2D3